MIKDRKSMLESRIARLEKLISGKKHVKNESADRFGDLMDAVEEWFDGQGFGDEECFALSEFEADELVLDCCEDLVNAGWDEDEIFDWKYEIEDRLAELGDSNCGYADESRKRRCNGRRRCESRRRVNEQWCRFKTAREVRAAAENGEDLNGAPKTLSHLMTAAIDNNPAVVRALIAAGVDVNKGDDRGHTALDYATANDSTKVEPILIAAGAEYGPDNKKRMRDGFPAYRGHRNPYGRDYH